MYSSGAGLLIKGISIFSAILVPKFKTKRIKPLIHSGLNIIIWSLLEIQKKTMATGDGTIFILCQLYTRRKWLLQVRKVIIRFYHFAKFRPDQSHQEYAQVLGDCWVHFEEGLFGDRNVKNNKYNNKPTKEAPNKWERITL